ncbi:hypothetical protein BHM03_00042171 [Ensete ventricosum]|nr:hypothetical protein BHM03_00042171 [Ensete ventricosum]
MELRKRKQGAAWSSKEVVVAREKGEEAVRGKRWGGEEEGTTVTEEGATKEEATDDRGRRGLQ